MTVTRSAQRPGAPKKQVDAAVRTVRAIFDEGVTLRNMLRKATARGERKMAWVEKEAEKRGMNRDYLWKAMMFTDPETGFNTDELEELCRLVKDNRRIVGRAFVAKLVSIPKKSRMMFAEEILTKGLSLNELDDLLTQRYGRRKRGGRRPRMLANRKDTLVGLDSMCVSWTRMFQFLSEEPAPRTSGRSIRLAGLPDDVRVAVQVVDNSMQVLRQALDNHLPHPTGKGKTSQPAR
jgi:hypothetical protein